MKVLNLQCRHAHGFEGWFASEDDFQGQLARGLVECPLCGDAHITKMPSAPRLNLGASEPAPAAAPSGAKQEVMSAPNEQLQAAWMQLVKQVMTQTEDVGERFAEEARKIHYGETEERGIRGQASREETQALLEEGISVLPLPIPKGLKGPLQ
ncbi:DUF1178 family protein [Ramlibacter montanisoli]|uniref:DUF1178 family protein n=1 Tax=Ramlibacter montanisoli TaxID=2732512 RepID=A0A849K8H3_9BURK|nr:DUF1178 family protein [Ramlibacter montanisoli]NNU42377.1 DUF1178 family protein [Ramlibacter montanisoli]